MVRQTLLTMALLCALLTTAPSNSVSQPQESNAFKVGAVTWADGRPFSSHGYIDEFNIRDCEYLLHYPEGDFLTWGTGELVQLVNGTARRVTTKAGKVLQFERATVHADTFGIYMIATTEEVKRLWWLDGATAHPVKLETNDEVRGEVDFAYGLNRILHKTPDRVSILSLVKDTAALELNITREVPKGCSASTCSLGTDVGVTIDDKKRTDESDVLYRVVDKKLVPVVNEQKQVFRAAAIMPRIAGPNTFLGTIDTDKSQCFWRYKDGVAKEIEMPDGGVADGVAILGAATAGNHLYFSRWSEETETTLGWRADGTSVEPVRTSDGKQLSGSILGWRSSGSTIFADLEEDDDTVDESLWRFDGKFLRPLRDKEGKHIRSSFWSIRQLGQRNLLRLDYGDDFQFRFLVMEAGRETARLQRVDGKPFEGKVSFTNGRGGVYFLEDYGRTRKMWWIQR